MALVPHLPWEVVPSQTPPNSSPENRLTVIESVSNIVVRQPTCPTTEEAEALAEQLVQGWLYEGSYANRHVSLCVEENQLNLLHNSIAKNKNATTYLYNFGHQAIQHHHLLLGAHHHSIKSICSSFEGILAWLSLFQEWTINCLQDLLRDLHIHEKWLDYLRGHDQSIVDNLDPHINN